MYVTMFSHLCKYSKGYRYLGIQNVTCIIYVNPHYSYHINHSYHINQINTKATILVTALTMITGVGECPN